MKRKTIKQISQSISINQFLILALLLLITIIIFLFVYLVDIVNWFREFVEEQPDDAEVSAYTVHIPDMSSTSNIDRQLFFYEHNSQNPLINVCEAETYTQIVRIAAAYAGDISSEQLTIHRNKDKYKVESDARIITCNGENLYLDYGNYQLAVKPEETLYFKEAGMTSLTEIKRMAQNTEQYEILYRTSEDSRTITVEITDTVDDLRMVFDIELESGLVTAERFYSSNTLYRTVLTEYIDLSVQFSDTFFELPLQKN